LTLASLLSSIYVFFRLISKMMIYFWLIWFYSLVIYASCRV